MVVAARGSALPVCLNILGDCFDPHPARLAYQMIHGTSKIVALAIEQNLIHRIGPCQIGKEIAGKKDCVGERRYGRRCVGADPAQRHPQIRLHRSRIGAVCVHYRQLHGIEKANCFLLVDIGQVSSPAHNHQQEYPSAQQLSVATKDHHSFFRQERDALPSGARQGRSAKANPRPIMADKATTRTTL